MISNVQGPYVEHEGTKEELRIFLVSVQDDETGAVKECLQVYDIHNSHLENIGYMVAQVRRDNGFMSGERHIRMTKIQLEQLKWVRDSLNPQKV
jgi:hypothetical protein